MHSSYPRDTQITELTKSVDEIIVENFEIGLQNIRRDIYYLKKI